MRQGPRLATYEDLQSLPEHARAEILRGAIVTVPSGSPRQSRVRGILSSLIGGPFDDDDGRSGPGGWWIFLGVTTRFTPHDIVWPDLSGWRRVRLPAPWDMAPIDVRPDWICEVLSPSNQAHDRVTKRHLYAEHGVPFYWLVDPAERTLEAPPRGRLGGRRDLRRNRDCSHPPIRSGRARGWKALPTPPPDQGTSNRRPALAMLVTP
ncbi:MAG: Uma2 family endonuclease [Polyangiaceae bacterium]|nr:Uma2 family endonuclease [Polyangiaceae bacterium]